MRPEPPLRATSARHGGRLDRRPALCLITDRRRLTTALGVPAANWREPLLAQITAALAGGIDVVQVRERDLDDGILAAFARDCVRAARDRTGRVVINDRLDIAVAGGAHGVHLREDGILPGGGAPPRTSPVSDRPIGTQRAGGRGVLERRLPDRRAGVRDALEAGARRPRP